MIRLLPFIVIPILIISGLGYWRYITTKQILTTPQIAQQQDNQPVEVPKTLPAASVEDSVTKSAPQVNSLKSSAPQAAASGSLDPRLSNVESAVTELRARVAALERGTAVQTKSATVYIPLGTGGQNGDKNWFSISNYGATIDPAEYPGYSTMQMEVNFRLVQKSGTAYARLYNVTDNSYKEQVSTDSDVFSWQTSAGFTLPAGKKTYTLQMKSSEGAEAQLQSARIKVNF